MRRPCLADGCWALTDGTYCAAHKPKPKPRPYRYRPEYGGAWTRLSLEQRRRVPYCEQCGSTERLEADHVIAGSLEGGLMTLCQPCNLAKRRLRRG